MPAYIFIVIGEGAPNLQAGVLVRVVNDDMVPITGDVHCREEVGAMQQQRVAEACNGSRGQLKGGHCGSVVPPFHGHLQTHIT